MVLGTFHRLTTRLNFSRLDVAAARSDFAFSVCLGILEFRSWNTDVGRLLGPFLLARFVTVHNPVFITFSAFGWKMKGREGTAVMKISKSNVD